MPEGDTIFRTARSLGRALVAKPVTGFRSNLPWLTRFDEDTPITGQIVERVESRGKWLLLHFSGGAALATHMRMHGSWHLYGRGERWQRPSRDMRVVLENKEYQAVAFTVPVARFYTADALRRELRIPPPDRDILNPSFDREATERRFRLWAGEEIASVLINQQVLAGLGNVFKSEVCFLEGVNPFCPVHAITDPKLVQLILTAERLLAANVTEPTGNPLATYRTTTSRTGPGERLWVYGRSGLACRRCGTLIRHRLQGPEARVTFWCRSCQPMPDGTEIEGIEGELTLV